MPLSWNEIRDRAIAFAREWQDATSERAEAQTFWNEFFGVFGVLRRRVASFEEPAKKLGDRRGNIDAFWKGMLIVEHKSRGEDLNRAFTQALDYFPGIADRDLPKYVLVSDFARFRLHDLDASTEFEFPLKDLHKQIKRFGFIAGYAPQDIKPQDPVNIRAAEQMGKLHDLLKASGYGGHGLEVLLVRLVFCLFAEDTGIFSTQGFRDWLETRTAEDGSDLGPQLALLFQVLNTPENCRQKNLDEQIGAFPYVNGKLFEEGLQVATFDTKMRATLLDCCTLNWGAVSPAIFGALFQSIMDKQSRRNLGAHYTSEENILKLIKPLFLDDLWTEFNKVKSNKNRLFDFHRKLRGLTFLDPACGCGNFLVITYRELRLLELEVLHTAHNAPGSRFLNIHQELQLDVDQFHGIEIEEFPAQIAQVALWLIDHQMNVKVSEEFGMYFARIPLKTSPHIVNGNALKLNWSEVVPSERLSYILGNPPFGGKHYQSTIQKQELVDTLREVKNASDMDYVSAWFYKAAHLIEGTHIKVAFVATSSITQGEQVSLLWPHLLYEVGIRIHFAHRTFRWSNEARGQAAVHCVIIGFAAFDSDHKSLFDYDTPDSDPHRIKVSNISPYLTEGPNVVVTKRQSPICSVPPMRYGNKPTDDGNFILSSEEKDELLKIEPAAAPYIKRYMGSEDFINGNIRWCLWLKDVAPDVLRSLPKVHERVEKVRIFRTASSAAPTRQTATTPALFFYISQPDTDYIVVPEVSSERRIYVPIGFVSKDVICSNTNYLIPTPSLYVFGMLTSSMHMAWMRQTCGRLESRYRYSGSIVYNNFPWPDLPTEKQIKTVEQAAQAVLNARAQFPVSSLADLYDPDAMPLALVKAHQALDRAAEAAYGKKRFASDAERVAFLFELYQNYTSLLPSDTKPHHRRKTSGARS